MDQVQPKPHPSPLHPPFVSKSLTRDTKGARVEGGGVAVGHLLPPVLRPNSSTALIHQICQRQLSHLMGHPSLERTPLSEPQSQRCPALFLLTGILSKIGKSKKQSPSLSNIRFSTHDLHTEAVTEIHHSFAFALFRNEEVRFIC